jgi:pantetheine-phosphate adenylyltransferase
MKAIYPGSFDQFTNGHLDILQRALSLFGEVTVLVAGSSRKTKLLTVEERVELIRETVKDIPNVKVDSTVGLIMEYAHQHKVKAVIRGLRTPSDFEYEYMMATMNKITPRETKSPTLISISRFMARSSFRCDGNCACD